MSIESIKQFIGFMIIFITSLALALYLFYVLKNKTINVFGSDELKEANNQFNELIDQAPKKLKNMVKKND